MSPNERRSEWTVFAGIALVVLGLWLLVERFFADLIAPLRVVVDFLGRIGWPLALIGLGVLVIYAARGRGAAAATGRTLMRSRSDRMVGGVLGGIASYFAIDPTIVRVIFVVFAVVTGFGPAFLLYIIAPIVIPEEPVGSVTQGSPPPAPPESHRPASRRKPKRRRSWDW